VPELLAKEGQRMSTIEPQNEGLNTRPWTSRELQALRENSHLGAVQLAAMLERSVFSVRKQAKKNRISLRRKGERRGLVLGQPTGVSWQENRLRLIHTDIIDGKVRMEDLEQRIRDYMDPDVPTCPGCATRPIRRQATGLCEVCHLHMLARAHRETQAEADAQRELWKARQDASRRARRRKANTQTALALDDLDDELE
jgi:ribosomal protein L37AE/L43A